MSAIPRLRWNQLQVFLVPAVLLLAAMGWLVLDSLRIRSKQLSKYEVPIDHSGPTMLAFMRTMDGSVHFSESILESSNAELVRNAIHKAHKYLQLDQQSLTDEEKHEAEFYHVSYTGTSIIHGQADSRGEVDEFLREAKEFLISAKAFTSREQQVSSVSIQVLDGLGRVDEEREIINWILEQIAQRPEFASDAARATSQNLKKIEGRLQMINEILVLESQTIDDRRFDLESLRGKVVLIEFWGTHCKPCIADFPALKRIYAANKDRGFEIVSVCLHAAPARIQSFATDHRLPWIQLCEDKSASSECNKALSERFGIQVVPTTLLIGTDGRVVVTGLRPLASDSERDLERWLGKLLRK
jgi:thiol-disulfide isomerase/thioredoxin